MSTLLDQPETAAPAVGPDTGMAALLEVPELRAQLQPISVELYHLLPEEPRTELLRGVIIRKVSKSPFHSMLAHRLSRAARKLEPDHVVFAQEPLTFIDSEPEPDVAVIRGSESDFLEVHPSTAELVIEVAVTSLSIDRAKAAIYAEAGVNEYWIVIAKRSVVEVYRQPVAGEYREAITVSAPAVLACPHLPGFQVDLAELFSGIPADA